MNLGSQRTDRNGHKQGGGHALARHVAYGNTQTLVVKLKIVVKITANFLGGSGKADNFQAGDGWVLQGEHSQLNLVGNFQIALNTNLGG